MSIWFKYFQIKILDISKYLNSHVWLGGRRSRDRMVVGFTMFVNGSQQNWQSLERTFHICFLPSFSSFGSGVSEEKMKM
jgi:hypothetical protein